MKAMLQTDSDKADDIVNLMQPICNNYSGTSGSCRRLDSGDRSPLPFDIWEYGYVNGKVDFVRYGVADSITDCHLRCSALVFTPPGP